MFPLQCFFCNHINPAGAKFCNDCGSPLHLKPCRQCEAINDQAAKNCYKCGKDDPALISTAEAPPALLPCSAAESVDVLSRRHDEATAQDCESCVEVVALEPRPPDRDTSSPASGNSAAASPASSHNPGIALGRHPRPRAALAGLPPAALLAAIAVSAFYAYLHPLHVREWLSAKLPPAGENRGGMPTQFIPGTIGVPATSSPAVNLETSSVSVAGVAAGTPPNESSIATTSSSVREDGTPAIGPRDIAEQTPPSTQSPAEAPSAATAATAEPREKTMRTVGDEVTPENTGSMATPATAALPERNSPPRDSRAAVPSHVASPGGCSKAVAALRPCSAKKTATNAKHSAKKPQKTSTKKLGSSQAPPVQTATPTTTELQTNAQGQ
jgi:ribosomal protein L40E